MTTISVQLDLASGTDDDKVLDTLKQLQEVGEDIQSLDDKLIDMAYDVQYSEDSGELKIQLK